MGIGVKHSSVASTFSTEGYWSAERQRILYYHDFHTKTKRCFRKRISAQLPATILLWLIVILVTISLTAMTAVVNGDSDVDDGSWTSRNGPIYMGSIANNPNFGNNVHTQKQFSVYSSDIIVNSDLDADEVNDDEEELDDESNNSIDGRLSTADIEKLHAIVMQGLRLTRIPNIANMNISHSEYNDKYTEYLKAVHRREAREAIGSGAALYSKKLYSFATTNYTSDIRHRRKRSINTENNGENDSFYLNFALTKDTVPADIDEATLRLLFRSHRPQLNDIHKFSRNIPLNTLSVSDTSNETDESDIDAVGDVKPDELTVFIYQLQGIERELVAKSSFRLPSQVHTSRWLDIDITSTLENWREISKTVPLRLEIVCPDCKRYGWSPFEPNSPETEPLLNVIGRNDDDHHREKRSRQHRHFSSQHDGQRRRPRKTDCSKDNQKCCRHPMDVVFKEIKGFEFIIQPKNFDAGYCRGRCPPRYNPAHHHAVLQSMIWKQDKSKAPRPCCAPSKLVELEVLHVDENDGTKMKVSTWSNMRVLDCACS